ncbi:MAG: hypothetical protein Q9213_006885 [Squamulea squamosa]
MSCADKEKLKLKAIIFAMVPCPEDDVEVYAKNLIELESARIETTMMGNNKVAGNHNGLQFLRDKERHDTRIEKLERENRLLKNEKVDQAHFNKLQANWEKRFTRLESDLSDVRLELATLKAIGESLFDIRRRELHKLFKYHPDITAQFDYRLIQHGNTTAHEGNALADAALFQRDQRDDRHVYMKLYGLTVEEVIATVNVPDTRRLLSEMSSYATIFFKRATPSPDLQRTFTRFIDEVRKNGYKVPDSEPHTSDLGLALSAYQLARNTFGTEKDPAAADPRETAKLPDDQGVTYEATGTVADSYDNQFSYMHEDSSVDQIRMKDFMEEYPIFRRDPPVLLKATKDGVELNAADKRLLPGRVFGFVLRSQTWAALSIRLVKDLPVKQDGFDQLVLPDGHKDLVRALVKTHSRGARPASGPVEDRDHQVDLTTPRGLFPITCGDIGETATSVEANLGKSFQLAHQCGCVLLLDEADVFMAKRSGSDIQRNSLVSVFLRILGYYPGILFLTTNRVGIFEPAFKSRIHISLYYPPLNGVTTIKIWKVNINRTRTSEKRYEVDEDRILEFAKEHFLEHDEGGRWNGRQIRNAFQTAIALAEYDATEDMRRRFSLSDTRELPTLKPRITVDHFRKVASAASDFDRYLKDVYGGRDEADRASGESLRKDDWGQQAVATIRPPMRGGHNSRGYYQQAQYRQQRFHGRDMYHTELSFEEMDPFQESKHPVLPNEVDGFNRRPSPDHRSMTRPDRGRYDQCGGPSGGLGSLNTPSPWSVACGSAHAGRMQTPQNGRPRTMGTAHYEESGYKKEMTNNYFSEFDETDPREVRGHGREGQGRASAC